MELDERENQSEETPKSPEAFVISKSRILLNFCLFCCKYLLTEMVLRKLCLL